MSCFSGFVHAQTNEITVNKLTWSSITDEVKIDGNVNTGWGRKRLTVRVVKNGLDLTEADENRSSVQNIAQVDTDFYGAFGYSFEMNYQSASDIEKYDVYIAQPGTDYKTSESFYCVGREAKSAIESKSVIMNYGNNYAKVFGTDTYIENVPYIENEIKYADIEFLTSSFGGAFNKTDNGFALTLDNHSVAGAYGSSEVSVDGKAVNLSAPAVYKNTSYAPVELFDYLGKYTSSGNKVVVVSNGQISDGVDVLAGNTDIFVSPNGSDSNDGTISSPLLTINKALELAEKDGINELNHVVINLLPGDYNIEKPIKINNTKNITIENYADSEVSINGGIKLSKSDFEKVRDDETLSRVGESVRNNLYKLDLSKYLNVKSAKEKGYGNYYRLYENDEEQLLARYPNAEYAIPQRYDDDISNGYILSGNSRTKTWTGIENAWIGGFHDALFFFRRCALVSADRTTGAVQAKTERSLDGISTVFYNIFEELDIPGEWYIDADTSTLYYSPVGNLTDVELTYLEDDLIQIENSDNITISGLEVKHGDGNGIYVSKSNDVNLDRLHIHSIGKNGVYISDSYRAVVRNSEINDVVESGVYVNSGIQVTLTPGECGAENCHIYDFSDENTYRPAVNLFGVGNFAKKNTIHDSMSIAIMFEGNDLLIENNEVYNAARDVFDTGVIGGASLNERRGNVVKNNYIHDIYKSYQNWSGIYSIYIDNMGSATEVTGNIVADAFSGGLFGGGRDNTIKNNMFIDCNIGTYDTRGTLGNWCREYKPLYPQKLLEDPAYDENLWYSKYPSFKEFVEDSKKEKEYLDSGVPDENGNMVYDETLKWDAGIPKNVTITDNLVINDKKSKSMNPVGIWWKIDKEGYNTVYQNNVGIAKDSTQIIDHEEKLSHDNDGGALKYEITNEGSNQLKKKIENVVSGELYKVSAWVYSENDSNLRKANIEVAYDEEDIKNQSFAAEKYPLSIPGNENAELTSGKWTEIYCYYAAQDITSHITISFPNAQPGDVFYIDDVKMDRIIWDDMNGMKYGDEMTVGEFKYYPNKYDLSKTKQLVTVGEEADINVYTVGVVANDSDSNGKIMNDEMSYKVEKLNNLTVASSDESVIAVENGKLTAKAPGVAVITAKDSDGISGSICITAYDERNTFGMQLTSPDKFVKIKDPVYGGEVMKMYRGAKTDLGVKTGDGVVIGFSYYENGVLTTEKDNSHGLCASGHFGFTLGGKDRGIMTNDGNAKVYQNFACEDLHEVQLTLPQAKRTAGWHQLTGVMKSNGDDTDTLTIHWYYDGVPLKGEDSAMKVGQSIIFEAKGTKRSTPFITRDVYAIAPNGTEVKTDEKAKESYLIDSFADEVKNWASSDTSALLDNILDGNYGYGVSDFKSWFVDFDNRDFTVKDDSWLQKNMPDFEIIDFKAIGNSEKVGGELKAPTLRYPVNNRTTDGTVELFWNEVSGASMYDVTISRNADMTDVIYKNTVGTNTDKVVLTESGRYYYTVTAHNLSKLYKSNITSEVESFTVGSGIKLDGVDVTENETADTAVFTYTVPQTALNAKIILAERTPDGKTVNVKMPDVPEVSDGKIKISCDYTKGNILECYIWRDMKALYPLCKKATTDKK